ncbi:ROK family protein [Neobacillus sp. MER 74]|uniref:ROK family protein n=1 Tax=Neobacillus sp. MER 74 TaxID=2939566 RepID=UPI0020401E52|nr:ROK family protein [Neobacillus sp. MER 74]MCM3116518.1 ROK family protein [Neobacillus sp. MER 74]
MKATEEFAIGLDIGGTKILSALVSENGEVVSKIQCDTKGGAENFSQQIIFAIESLLEKDAIEMNRIKGIGIATAGVIDSKKKEILYASNLGLENFQIGNVLERRFGLPVQLYNDANAAAVGEWLWGSGKGKHNLIYITVSTGIGAGIISNDSLLTGSHDSAGEFGHISINLHGPVCPCGNKGCLENYASGTAIADIARQRLANGEVSLYFTEELDQLTAVDICATAKMGDSFSIGLLKEVGESLGLGIINLIHLFNTEAVILGGGVMSESELILPSIRSTVQKHGIQSMVEQVKIEKSTLGSYACVVGATGLFFCKADELAALPH